MANRPASVNPAYFQPGVLAQMRETQASLLHGRKGRARKGTTKHGQAGMHYRKRHESPMPHITDPWKHQGMGRSKR